MRIAAISDIHGNLGALNAVLEDIALRGADVTVNLGDIVSGPLQPRETADRLMALDLPTIRGNHERQALASDLESMGDSDRHAAMVLDKTQRAWLAALPATAWLDDEVFLCHATPDSDVDSFLEDIRDGKLVAASQADIENRCRSCAATVILCGHTHIPRLASPGDGRLIVNPGSVGIQAYIGHHPVPHSLEIGSPHARYALIERTQRGWRAEFIALPYDWNAAARIARENDRARWERPLRTGFL